MLRTKNRLHRLHLKLQTIETINTIHSGRSSEISSHANTTSDDNALDLADFYANESIHHDRHDPGFFPTENIFPNHACNKM